MGCNSFIKGFSVSMAGSFRQILQNYSEKCTFCSAIQYIVSTKQPVGSAHEGLAESLETVFDNEAHFIVKFHNFLQLLVLPRHPFIPDEPFLPHPPRQNNFQNSSPLETSETALVCIVCNPLSAEVGGRGLGGVGWGAVGGEPPTKFSKRDGD